MPPFHARPPHRAMQPAATAHLRGGPHGEYRQPRIALPPKSRHSMPPSINYDLLREDWLALAGRIARAAAAAGRDPGTITVLAVSKTFGPEAVRAAHALGQRAFGENYVQEAVAKMAATADLPGLQWHLIGPLQSNKANDAAARFAWVESVDRLGIAERLSRARPAAMPPLDVCIQVNISGETSKSGVAPAAVLPLAQAVAALPRLRLRGLMGIAEPTADAARQRAQFRSLRQSFDACRSAGLPVDTLSMGMSADLEAAIFEGATRVRVGSAFFGARAPRSPG
jgi:pyridoxal phosphate enzyme (YggS family)